MNRKTLPTENLLEDTDGLLRPPLEGGTKQPISVLLGAVAGCDRFLLTSASLGDVIAFEGWRRPSLGGVLRSDCSRFVADSEHGAPRVLHMRNRATPLFAAPLMPCPPC